MTDQWVWLPGIRTLVVRIRISTFVLPPVGLTRVVNGSCVGAAFLVPVTADGRLPPDDAFHRHLCARVIGRTSSIRS